VAVHTWHHVRLLDQVAEFYDKLAFEFSFPAMYSKVRGVLDWIIGREISRVNRVGELKFVGEERGPEVHIPHKVFRLDTRRQLRSNTSQSEDSVVVDNASSFIHRESVHARRFASCTST